MFAAVPYQGPERRAFIRLPYETEVQGRASDAREGTARVQEVSRTGLRLEAPCPLTPGTPVSLHFGDVQFEDKPVALDGRVVWMRPNGGGHLVGVVFDHTDNRTIATASELVYAALSRLSSRFAPGNI